MAQSRISSFFANLRKPMRKVVYKAPGLLHGVYCLEKRGPISHTELVYHALQQRYGDAADMMLANAVGDVRIEVQGTY